MAAAQSLSPRRSRVHDMGSLSLLSGVGVRGKDKANEAIAAGVRLGKIEGSRLACVAQRLRQRCAGEGKMFLLETSGSSTESNSREHAIPSKWCPRALQQQGYMIISCQ